MFDFSSKHLDDLIKRIFKGDITKNELPEPLYHAIAERLRDGLYKGFGSTLKQSFGTGDAELLAELRENIYMFSAAKTFQQVNEMTEKLIDNDGEIRPFSEFKKDAGEIFDTYNKDYLETEYNTAIGQGQIAVKWDAIEKQKDILPYLQYSAIGDACDICAPLDGLCAHVDDPIWNTVMPLNHFNCHCLVEQLDKKEGEQSVTPDAEEVAGRAEGKMQDVFKMNAGKDRIVFSPDHPYFSVPKADKEFAMKNFGLNIPEND